MLCLLRERYNHHNNDNARQYVGEIDDGLWKGRIYIQDTTNSWTPTVITATESTVSVAFCARERFA